VYYTAQFGVIPGKTLKQNCVTHYILHAKQVIHGPQSQKMTKALERTALSGGIGNWSYNPINEVKCVMYQQYEMGRLKV